MKFFIFFFISCLVNIKLFARSWRSIPIPGAKCGNGQQYKVFLDIKDPAKLAVEFMGGGACWSAKTCYGPNLRTWIHRIPAFPVMGYLSGPQSLFKNHSMIYFPYCTGDVHLGAHQGSYIFGIKVYHFGYSNVVKTLKYLEKKNLFHFNKIDDLTLYGSSAGAIGALMHAETLEEFIPTGINKTLIADSPGLHFGDRFWYKFSIPLLNDFSRNLFKIHVNLDEYDGLIAPQVEGLCGRLQDWKIGFLQSSRDRVMSKRFGSITQKEHERLVFSEFGLFNIVKKIQNCHAWIPKNSIHTFLLFKGTSKIKANNISAIDFVHRIYGTQNRSTRSKRIKN